MKIYIMRHGKTVLNSLNFVQGSGSNSSLTKNGIQKTLEAKKIIDGLNIERVYTGDLGRQLQTFELIDNDYDHTIDKNLNEAYFGGFENKPVWYMYLKIVFKTHYFGNTKKMSINEIMDFVKLADPTHSAENSNEIIVRVNKAMNKILNCGLNRVLIISSGMFLETLMEEYNPNIKFMRMKNCGIYLIDTDNHYQISTIFN